MASKPTPTFRELSQELDSILSQLQAEDIDVDEALSLHEKGKALIAELEKRLKSAEHTVKKIKSATT